MLWKGSRKEMQATPASPPPVPEALPCAGLMRLLQRARQVQPEPSILMLGELCGGNVTYLGERGFRVCIETDVRAAPEVAWAGALVWDAFSLMPQLEARRRATLLHAGLMAGGAVLAVFAAPNAAPTRARARYRILSESLIRVEGLEGRRAVVHPYQNRDIIRLFEGFDLENLHTRRDGQREALFFKERQGAAEA